MERRLEFTVIAGPNGAGKSRLCPFYVSIKSFDGDKLALNLRKDMAKIVVDNAEITILEINEKDYISLTDMVRNIDNGLALIEKWLRNKNTIEFLGIWEGMYNPNFNSPEFEGIKNMAGLRLPFSK